MRRGIKSLIVGLATGLTGIVLVSTPLGISFEQQIGLQTLFKLRGAVAAPEDVVVIAIDHRTGARLGLPRLPRDWPRTTHADLVSRLREYDVAVTVFDMSFRSSQSAANDEAFAQSMRQAGRVALISRLNSRRLPLSALEFERLSGTTDVPGTTPAILDADQPRIGSIWIERLSPPTPILADAAAGLAPFLLLKSQDDVFQYWAFKSSADDVATLPVVALELMSTSMWKQWGGILLDAGMDISDEQRWIDPNLNAAALRERMRLTRVALRADPALVDRVRRRIEAQTTTGEEDQRVLHALLNTYAGDDRRTLNLYGPPGTIKTIPYHRIIRASETEAVEFTSHLAGKVALIGFSDLYDPDQPDGFQSAFTTGDGVDISGVELAATAFANLLHGHTLRQPEPAIMALVLFAAGCFLGVILFSLPALLSIPLALAACVLYVLVSQYWFSNHYYWLPMATPLLVQLPMALFIGLLAHYLFERREERKLTEAIGYYLPQEIVRELTQGGHDSKALNKTIFTTCLATDMKGFTTLAESMNPDQLASFMNGYFETVASPLKRNDVDVTEFRADGIMCAWLSAPDQETVRHEAIIAAIEVAQAIKRFRHAQLSTSLAARIGLESGWAYVGHSGGGGQFVYSILGDCANTASRIEGLNNYLGTEILASQAVVEGVDGILYRPLGDFTVVGKREPLAIVEIIDRESQVQDHQLDLCVKFAEALSYFTSQQWRDAADMFVTLAAPPFEDGPSRLYLQRCLELLKLTTLPKDPTIIIMDKK